MGEELHDEVLPPAMGSTGLALLRRCGREDLAVGVQVATMSSPRSHLSVRSAAILLFVVFKQRREPALRGF